MTCMNINQTLCNPQIKDIVVIEPGMGQTVKIG